jgi:hypothetical protein
VIELIARFRQATDQFSVFIASFSKEPDLLSQWRGYNDGKGYAIGVNGDWLSQNADQQGFRLIPVLYDAGEQRRVVQARMRMGQRQPRQRTIGGSENVRHVSKGQAGEGERVLRDHSARPLPTLGHADCARRGDPP